MIIIVVCLVLPYGLVYYIYLVFKKRELKHNYNQIKLKIKNKKPLNSLKKY